MNDLLSKQLTYIITFRIDSSAINQSLGNGEKKIKQKKMKNRLWLKMDELRLISR